MDREFNLPLIITVVVGLLLALFVTVRCTHRNDVQNFQLTQSLGGELAVHSDGGFVTKSL